MGCLDLATWFSSWIVYVPLCRSGVPCPIGGFGYLYFFGPVALVFCFATLCVGVDLASAIKLVIASKSTSGVVPIPQSDNKDSETQLEVVGGPTTPRISVVNNLEKAIILHLGITIASIPFPTLIYLIGFPFCYVYLSACVKDKPATITLVQTYNAYVGIGIFTWVLHLIFLICLCAIPAMVRSNPLSIRVSLAVLGSFMCFFTLVTALQGVYLAQELRMTKNIKEIN